MTTGSRMDINDFEDAELVSLANARMEAQAAAIFAMAAALVAKTTVQEAVRLAKAEWLSLLKDSELADFAAQPPHKQAAGRLALRRIGDGQ